MESLRKRVGKIKPGLTLRQFLQAVDSGDKIDLNDPESNRVFRRMKAFYIAVKKIKNKTKNGSYLDEERFNKLYSSKKPSEFF